MTRPTQDRNPWGQMLDSVLPESVKRWMPAELGERYRLLNAFAVALPHVVCALLGSVLIATHRFPGLPTGEAFVISIMILEFGYRPAMWALKFLFAEKQEAGKRLGFVLTMLPWVTPFLIAGGWYAQSWWILLYTVLSFALDLSALWARPKLGERQKTRLALGYLVDLGTLFATLFLMGLLLRLCLLLGLPKEDSAAASFWFLRFLLLGLQAYISSRYAEAINRYIESVYRESMTRAGRRPEEENEKDGSQ